MLNGVSELNNTKRSTSVSSFDFSILYKHAIWLKHATKEITFLCFKDKQDNMNNKHLGTTLLYWEI